jgi:SSS family solute:Na+ symporter
MTQHLDSATMPEFFGKRFGSRSLKVAASVIIFIFLIPYTASLYNGLSRLFGMAFDIDYTVCVIVMAVLTGVYVIAGGYMATAINDFIQGIIMLFGICAVILAVLNSQGGFLAALEGLAQLVKDAGAELVGAGIVIEKAFQPGGDRLRAKGLRIEALARVQSMNEETGVTFADD